MIKTTLFVIDKNKKQLKCLSIDEWIHEMQYINIMQYYSAIKKNGVL